MSTKIRLARGGAKKRPYYRIVVADSRQPRDGRFIEKVGTYNPLLPDTDPMRVTLVEDRIRYWIGTGAETSDRVAVFLKKAGLLQDAPKKDAKPAEKPAAKKASKKAA